MLVTRAKNSQAPLLTRGKEYHVAPFTSFIFKRHVHGVRQGFYLRTLLQTLQFYLCVLLFSANDLYGRGHWDA